MLGIRLLKPSLSRAEKPYMVRLRFCLCSRVEQLRVPCDIKLTLFIGGGIEDGAQAPHLTFIPIPLLSKVHPQDARCQTVDGTPSPAALCGPRLPPG